MTNRIWTDVDAYFESHLVPEDAVLAAALAASEAAGLPSIQVSALQGKLLYLLALAQGAQRILEVGTLGGYSSLWLARALPTHGQLVTLELESRHADVARQNFTRAGLAAHITVQVGPALESLARLQAQAVAPFDLVFIDADKPNNLAYVQAALKLARPGSLIVVDNVVRDGSVISPTPDPAAKAVQELVEWLGRERRLTATVIQTVGNKGYDGFLLARVPSQI